MASNANSPTLLSLLGPSPMSPADTVAQNLGYGSFETLLAEAEQWSTTQQQALLYVFESELAGLSPE